MSDAVASALFGVTGGVIVALIPFIIGRLREPSRRAKERDSVTEAAEGLVSLLRTELDRLNVEVVKVRADVHTARTEADMCLARVRRLEIALVQAGIDPRTINGPRRST